jgi:hypothetical protein
VELYIDTGEQQSTEALFDALRLRAPELERDLGSELHWERLDNRRASRLATYRALPVTPPFDESAEFEQWALATMVKWNDALRPVLRELVAMPSAAPSSAI